MPKPAPKRKPALMIERKSPRGLVPSLSFARFDLAYNDFLSQMDPRHNENTQYALASASDMRFREFLRLIGEPKCAKWTLAAVAKNCNITLPEMADFWRKSQLQRGMTKAIDAIPALTDDLIGDAKTQRLVCERCDGLCVVEVDEEDTRKGEERRGKARTRACPNCTGTGTTRKPGDTHARDKLLEMTGLVGKRGGAAVVINQNFGGMGVGSATDRLDQITFTVDADPILPDSDEPGI